MECHHLIPRNKGGLDNYDNLVLITREAHKLIHSTQQETINKYLKLIPNENETILRINWAREFVGNSEICL